VQRYNRKSLLTITPATTMAVSVADMKAFLSISDTTDDDMIEDFIFAAQDAIKRHTGMTLMTETLELRMDRFDVGGGLDALFALGPGIHTGSYPQIVGGSGVIELGFGPIQSITSITTYALDNTSSVFDSTLYFLDAAGWRVCLDFGAIWPVNLRRHDAVAVRYVAGYASAAAIPRAITHALKVHVAAMYECREGCEMPPACMAALADYRRFDALAFT